MDLQELGTTSEGAGMTHSQGRSRKTRPMLLLLAALVMLGCGRPERQKPTERKETSAPRRGDGFVLSNVVDFGHRHVRSFAFDGTSRQLFVSFDDRSSAEVDAGGDRLYQWDVSSNTLVHTYSLEPQWIVDEIFASEGASRLVLRLYQPRHALGSAWGKYLLVDPQKHVVVATDLGPHDDRSAEVLFGRSGKRFCLNIRRTLGEPLTRFVFDEEARPAPASSDEFLPREKPHLSVIEASKATMATTGLNYADDMGQKTLVVRNQWHSNFDLTKDGRYVVTTTWDGELVVWSTADKQTVHREKLAEQYGYLAYDAKDDRFLLGDAMYNGTTFLRQFVIRPATSSGSTPR
jgi:hypothetical protein